MVSTQVFDNGTKMYEVLRQLDGELNTKRFAVIYSHIGQSGEIMPKKFYRLESVFSTSFSSKLTKGSNSVRLHLAKRLAKVKY
jgi:hypothetical protein